MGGALFERSGDRTFLNVRLKKCVQQKVALLMCQAVQKPDRMSLMCKSRACYSCVTFFHIHTTPNN